MVKGVVALHACGRATTARAFSYGGAAKELKPVEVQVTEAGVTTELEPYSFTVIELSIEGAAP
jgi:hypothetical protein